MTEKEMLLIILAEECAETAHRISKALRFTLEEVEPNQKETSLTNGERILYEYNDILAIMEILQERGVFPKKTYPLLIEDKKSKVEKYLEYSRTLGTIQD